MFNLINLQDNTMFYSSNSTPLNKLSQKYTSTLSSKKLGGGAVKSFSYKELCCNFNINNMTTSSSFRYNYL